MTLDIRSIQDSFSLCTTYEETYKKIIEWGHRLSPFRSDWKTTESLVKGCQSIMYLHSEFKEGVIFFTAASDALISAGLAAILIEAYTNHSPEFVLTTPPDFLEELGIPASLTPGRANGLASLYLKMKQEALKFSLSQRIE
ncbi:MAG: SufE family protein [Chlamydiales bacterium]